MWRLFIGLWLASSTVWAGKFLPPEVVTDGSIDPPGDKVTLSYFFLPKDREATFEMRLMAELGDEQFKRQFPVRATAKAPAEHKDAEGNWVAKGTLERKTPGENELSGKNEIVIPYAEISLAKGEYRIFYEVTVTVKDAAGKELDAEVSATKLTLVQVTEEGRTEIKKRTIKETADATEIETEGYVIVDGEAVKKMTATPRAVVSAAGPLETVTIDPIPGGFTRKGLSPKEGEPNIPLSSKKKEADRFIRFATDRNLVDAAKKNEEAFGNESAFLRYGTANVNIPVKTHKKGELKTPGWFGKNPDEHFYIETLSVLPVDDQTAFFKGIEETDQIVFVHGFANSFKDALVRAAQLQFDWDFPGKVIAFSWPSLGKASMEAYDADEAVAPKSGDHLANLISRLIREHKGTSEKPFLNLYAHSMGNLVTLTAINKLLTDKVIDPKKKIFNNIILAAPDVKVTFFASMIPRIAKITNRITFYWSKNDMALGLSEKRHRLEANDAHKVRAGRHPMFLDQDIGTMDTIEASNITSSLLGFGHDYYGGAEVLIDLNLDVVYGLPPEKRSPPLGLKHELPDFPGFPHYRF